MSEIRTMLIGAAVAAFATSATFAQTAGVSAQGSMNSSVEALGQKAGGDAQLKAGGDVSTTTPDTAVNAVKNSAMKHMTHAKAKAQGTAGEAAGAVDYAKTQVGGAAESAAGAAGNTVNGAVGTVGNTVGGVMGAAGGALKGATGAVGGATQGSVSAGVGVKAGAGE